MGRAYSLGLFTEAAPCPNSGRATVRHGTVHPGHVVQPAVIHERIVSTHVREVALAQAPQDIVDVAVGAGTFKTLAAALGAADVVKLKEAKTAGDKTLAISTADGVKVGTATGMSKVVKTDIKAKNGAIHVIDAVILP